MTRTSVSAPAAFARGCHDYELLSVCHPDEIVDRAGMTVETKRAVLAAWASDAHAVEGAPALRQLDSGAVVRVDDILSALRRLDRLASDRRPPKAGPPGKARRGARRRIRPWTFRSRRDDDEGPPPGAPAVGLCVRGMPIEACA
jgi:hypothetical protein